MSLVIAVVLACGVIVGRAHQAAPAPAVMTPADLGKLPMPPADHTFSYGQDANQIGELRLPAGPGPHPIIVLVHGGCWMPQAAR
jgi:acetyl esterase/lipase